MIQFVSDRRQETECRWSVYVCETYDLEVCELQILQKEFKNETYKQGHSEFCLLAPEFSNLNSTFPSINPIFSN